MAMVMVGATIVGAIGTSWHGDLKRTKTQANFDYTTSNPMLLQGDEMGYFKLGSTVILLFANSEQVQWNSTLHAGSPIQFGSSMGNLIPSRVG